VRPARRTTKKSRCAWHRLFEAAELFLLFSFLSLIRLIIDAQILHYQVGFLLGHIFASHGSGRRRGWRAGREHERTDSKKTNKSNAFRFHSRGSLPLFYPDERRIAHFFA